MCRGVTPKRCGESSQACVLCMMVNGAFAVKKTKSIKFKVTWPYCKQGHISTRQQVCGINLQLLFFFLSKMTCKLYITDQAMGIL